MENFNTFTLLITISIILLIVWFKRRHNYWKQLNIETPPYSIIFGHIKELILQRESFREKYTNIYKQIKSKGLRYGGIYFFLKPQFVPVDLDIIKSILQNENNNFLNRGFYINEEGDPLSANLFSLEGNRWRHLRNKLSPTFTSGKMKMMFPTLTNCATGLTEVLKEDMGFPVDIKDLSGRYTTDVIGSCAFGLECNSLADPYCEFRLKGKSIFCRGVLETLKMMMIFALPRLMKRLHFKLFGNVHNFMMNVVKETVSYRENNNIFRNDFLHLLIQLKNRGQLVDDGKLKDDSEVIKDNTLTMDEVAAQVFVFFAAGFETSSTTMSFCLFELARNRDIQAKVRKEVCEVLDRHEGEFTYRAAMEMTYLEKVIKETLRKYPILPHLNRVCAKEYQIPGTQVVLEKSTTIVISVDGIQNDPEYYPEPEKFDPERFSEENIKKRPNFTFLAFGDGPRVCIGMRFGMMQVKVGVATLLKHLEFTVSSKTILPMEFDTSNVFLGAKGDIWLEYKNIT